MRHCHICRLSPFHSLPCYAQHCRHDAAFAPPEMPAGATDIVVVVYRMRATILVYAHHVMMLRAPCHARMLACRAMVALFIVLRAHARHYAPCMQKRRSRCRFYITPLYAYVILIFMSARCRDAPRRFRLRFSPLRLIRDNITRY